MTECHKNKPYILDKIPHFNLVFLFKHAFGSILVKYLQDINTGEVFNIFILLPKKHLLSGDSSQLLMNSLHLSSAITKIRLNNFPV